MRGNTEGGQGWGWSRKKVLREGGGGGAGLFRITHGGCRSQLASRAWEACRVLDETEAAPARGLEVTPTHRAKGSGI